MFSGIGTNIGIELTNPEGDLSNLLKTELPEETQQAIRNIAEGILERNDYSFIPKSKEQEEFSKKLEQAYQSTLEEYIKSTRKSSQH